MQLLCQALWLCLLDGCQSVGLQKAVRPGEVQPVGQQQEQDDQA
jgi:hypothetical protein